MFFCYTLATNTLTKFKLKFNHNLCFVFFFSSLSLFCFGNWIKGLCGNWIEIAYGTRSGSVRVIVQHPETVGHSPQLFQTFTVHQSPVTKVKLSEEFLISVCSEYNHVRTWRVPRFRGMISTQPGSTPEASFKVLSKSIFNVQIHLFGWYSIWCCTICWFDFFFFFFFLFCPFRLYRWSQLIAHIVIRLEMILVHLANKMMNKCLYKKLYRKRINYMYDWHRMVIVCVLLNQLMDRQLHRFVYMNVKNHLEWDRCQDDLFCPVTVMEQFKCGILPRHWNLFRKKIRRVRSRCLYFFCFFFSFLLFGKICGVCLCFFFLPFNWRNKITFSRFVILSTAQTIGGGPTTEELIQLLDQCDISNSLCSTPCMSPCLSSISSNTITRLKASNVAFLNQVHNNE